MTALTLQFEEKMFTHLKRKADDIGYSIDAYIMYLLAADFDKTEEKKSEDNIDTLLGSMQFHSGVVPVTENGKCAVAEMKYL